MAKHKRKLSKSGWALLVVLCLGIGMGLVKVFTPEKEVASTPTATPTAITTPDPENQLAQEDYEKYFELNPDYVCKIAFKNELLYNPELSSEDQNPGLIVRSKLADDGGDVNLANEEYFGKNIAGESISYGQEFMDARNVLNEDNVPVDQNLIIYGHLVYRDHNLKFGPLHLFEDSSVYSDYDTFTLTFNHEKRTYQVTDAYIYPATEFTGDLQDSPYATSYTAEELQKYMNKVRGSYENFLNTGIEIQDGDRFVTLQTCVENHPEKLFLVLGKEVSVEKY